MNELNINYSISKGQQMTNIVIASYFGAFGLFFCIKELIAKNYSVMFYAMILCIIFAIILLLKNTLWLPQSILKITNDVVESNTPKQKPIIVEWTNVSQVNIGPGYILLLTNGGQKQQKIDLLELKYKDITSAKSKILELCEHKNIPYKND